jgi:hypothetical protein
VKKTFRRVLASLLAILMVVFSVPFSAMAGYSGYTYKGYNDLGYTAKDTDEEFTMGDIIYIDNGDEMIMDNFTPEVHMIVSDIGHAKTGDFTDEESINTYYGSSVSLTYEDLQDSGKLLNPAQLKAGQRIALAIEFGGVDCFYSWQSKGGFDKTYLKAVRYTAKNGWTDVTETNTSQGVAVKGGTKYYAGTADDAGTVLNQATGRYYTAMTSSTPQTSSYIIHDDEVFGYYGLLSCVYTFEVLEDCDLSQVITLDMSKDAGTEISPYDVNIMEADYPDHISKFTYYTSTLPIVWDNYDAGDETPTTQYTVTFKDADGNVLDTKTYDEGTSADTVKADAPSLTGDSYPAYDETNHYTYDWDNEFTSVDSEQTYQVVKTTVAHTLVEKVVTAPTHTSAGETTYTCTCGYSKTEYPVATGHNYTNVVSDNNGRTHHYECPDDGAQQTSVDCTWNNGEVTTPATYTAPGEKTFTCTVCGGTKTEPIPQLTLNSYTVKFVDHNGKEVSSATYEQGTAGSAVTVPAVSATTYDSNGHTTYAWPSVDEVTGDVTYKEVATTTPHTLSDVAGTAKTPTCLVAGKQADQKCSGCAYTVPGAEIAKLSHDYSELVSAKVEATCTTAGKEAVYKCVNGCDQTTGGAEIKALGHDFSVKGETVAPTVKDQGYTTYNCSRCDATEKRDIVDALGVNITIAEGTAVDVTVNGEKVDAGKAVNVPYGSSVTLSVPDDTEGFVGWNANGTKVVSESTTATVTAIADVTYQPIVSVTDKITVTFYDMFQNVIDVQTVSNASELKAPETPVFVGYTFAGWSVTDLTTITEDTVVTANYTKNTTPAYTVTAKDCTITAGDKTATDTLSDLAYDTVVTVSADDATSWTVNGATVAYGTSYTFYVGSDVTVVAVKDSVTAKPVVAAVNTTKVDGSHTVVFLATRSIDGGQYVNAGFIYGKNLTDSDLALENVGKTGTGNDSGQVKAYYCATDALQFSLSYGIKAQTGTASAKAFLTYIDADGDLQVVYGNVQSYNYGSNTAK